jgi:hypothetical protein
VTIASGDRWFPESENAIRRTAAARNPVEDFQNGRLRARTGEQER